MSATLRNQLAALACVWLLSSVLMAQAAGRAPASADHARHVADCRRHELPCDASELEVERVFRHRYAPGRLLAAARHAGVEVDRLLCAAPADLRRLLRRVGDGELRRVSAPALERTAHRASRGLERLTGAIGSAALLVAGTLGTVATVLGALARHRP